MSARKLADITSGAIIRQTFACSTAFGVGFDRSNAAPAHLNRRPSVKTYTQELTAGLCPALVEAPELIVAVVTDEQVAEMI